MRKLIFLMLLATAASPAAARPDREDGARPERQAEQRAVQAERAPRIEGGRAEGAGGWRSGGGDADRRGGWTGGRGGADPAAVAQWREQRAQQAGQPAATGEQRSWGGRGGDRGGRWAPPVAGTPNPVVADRPTPDRRAWNGNRDGRSWRDGTRPGVGVPGQYGDPRASTGYDGRYGDRRTSGGYAGRYADPRTVGRPDGTWAGTGRDGRWNNGWRQDSRYDWRRYRDQNRFVFRIGSYYDPLGYGYRPLSVGFGLYAGYYQPDYWLNDPWQYRLPPVYGPYRWVRYYNDAVLVDIDSGEVVDVIRDFFW